MTDQELLAKTRRLMNDANQSESSQDLDRIDALIEQCLAEMTERGLTINDLPAWNEV